MRQLTRIKSLRSHTACTQFKAELYEKPIGFIPRPDLLQPYAYSPTQAVWLWNERMVIIIEESHKRYVVYAVDDSVPLLLEAEAEEVYIQRRR